MSTEGISTNEGLLGHGGSVAYAAPNLEVALNLPMDSYLRSPGWAVHDLHNLDRSGDYAVWAKQQGDKDTAATLFGTAVHCAVLEPHALDRRYGVTPPGHGNRKDVKEAKAAMAERGIIPLKEEQWDTLRLIRDRVDAHTRARELVDLAVLREVSVATKIRTTMLSGKVEILGKLRPDALLPEAEFIIDLKTTKAIERHRFMWEASTYNYHQSAAWYLDRMNDATEWYAPGETAKDALVPNEIAPLHTALAGKYTHHIILAIENTPPHDVQVFELDGAAVDLGRMQCNDSLTKLKGCLEAGKWEGLPGGILPLAIPQRDFDNYQRKLDARVAAGERV